MTKKILLKWLDTKKAAALAQVDRQEKAAREALLSEKLENSEFDKFADYILSRLTEIHDKLESWHKEHEVDVGPAVSGYGYLYGVARRLLYSNIPAAECLRKEEVHETQLDKNLKKQFETIRREVETTYDNVALNIGNLSNAKLGMEYLAELGFDLSALYAETERPVETALAVPINTNFLLLAVKENDNDTTDL